MLKSHLDSSVYLRENNILLITLICIAHRKEVY